MKTSTKLLSGGAVAALLAGGIASIASAQDASDSAIEEIVVTAQKRAKGLIDTPIAVSAYSGETIEQSNVRDIRDLQMLVPSLNVTTAQGSWQTVINIRSIGTSGSNVALEPSVGVYVDGVYRSRTGAAISDFLSVERIEVLRGPQSTLFGKNTSAGVMSIVTQKPQFEAGGKAAITYGNHDQKIIQGTFTGPIGDKVAISVSGNLNKRGGFITNLNDGSKVNNRDRWMLRGQVLFQPSDDVSFRIIVDKSEIDENCCAAPYFYNGPPMGAIAFLGGYVPGAIGTKNDFARETNFNGPLQSYQKDWGISGQLDWDLGGATFTSITAFRDFSQDSELDADFNSLDILQSSGESTQIETFTQELRLTSNGNKTVDWLVGAYYFDQKMTADDKVIFGADTRNYLGLLSGFAAPGFTNIDLIEQVVIPGIQAALDGPTFAFLFPGVPDPLLPGDFFAEGEGQISEMFTNDAKSWALFGQFDWHATEQLTITGGLRYTNEKKKASGVFNNVNPFSALNFDTLEAVAGLPAGTFAGFKPLQFVKPLDDFTRPSRKEDQFTGNVIIAYDVNDDMNTYASYSKGYKAGGYDISRNVTLDGDTDPHEFFPEKVSAFEVGLKARILDGRGRVNIAAFYQDVTDFQSNVWTGTQFDLKNAGDIRIKGIEMDAMIAATDNLFLTFAAAYTDAKFTSFVAGPCPVGDPSASCDHTGETKDDAPKWTMSATANYTQPISDNLEGFLRAEVYYRGGRNTAADLDPMAYVAGSTLVNGSIGLRGGAESGWELSLWVKNLFKEEYQIFIWDSVIQPGSYNFYPNDPRTMGVTLRGSF